ncbi:MAG: 4Fe-4S binding protein [Clostridia bacterium]
MLLEVATLAFASQLEEKVEEIPYKIINTDVPHFRCCVYKRAGNHSGTNSRRHGTEPTPSCHSNNLVKVLPAACEGCPISRFHVTDNCQNALRENAKKRCPFGAITMTGRGAYIDPAKCKECGCCASACPYNAIADLIRLLVSAAVPLALSA